MGGGVVDAAVGNINVHSGVFQFFAVLGVIAQLLQANVDDFGLK